MSISPSPSLPGDPPDRDDAGVLVIFEIILQQAVLPMVIWLMCAPFSWNPSVGCASTPLYLVHAFIAIAFGAAVGRMWPRFYEVGRWVWVLPVFFWIVGFAEELRRRSLAQTTFEYFCGEPASEGLAVACITVPAIICIGYSLGLRLGSRSAKSRP